MSYPARHLLGRCGIRRCSAVDNGQPPCDTRHPSSPRRGEAVVEWSVCHEGWGQSLTTGTGMVQEGRALHVLKCLERHFRASCGRCGAGDGKWYWLRGSRLAGHIGNFTPTHHVEFSPICMASEISCPDSDVRLSGSPSLAPAPIFRWTQDTEAKNNENSAGYLSRKHSG